jgi:hypothetical protein
MKRIAGVAVMAAFMSLSLVGVATAHTVKHDSTITFQVKKNGPDADTFEGTVRSDSDRCVADRVVRIYQVADGDDVLVGETTTDENGDYTTPTGDLAAGTYYAVVTRKVLRRDDKHTHVCKKAVSTERVVAEPAA